MFWSRGGGKTAEWSGTGKTDGICFEAVFSPWEDGILGIGTSKVSHQRMVD